MPKFPTFPTLYNETLQISTSNLKEWGYLNPKQIKSGNLKWSSNGNKTASISIKVNTQSEQPYIELIYKYGGQPRNYKVWLITIPSNLGKGLIWYFLCPQTNKRCRKLYSVGGYFLHREAFKGCMYKTQTQSKKFRQLDKTFRAYFRTDDLCSQFYQKHFKKTYAGKPTKKYLQIMKQVQIAESIPPHEIKYILLG